MKIQKMALLGLVSAFLLGGIANASILNLVEGKDLCAGRAVPVSATANLPGQTPSLTTVGAGLRTYSAFKLKIYCFQVLANDPTTYVKSEAGALSSLSAMGTVALRMDFVYSNVTTAQLKKNFIDGFNANGVDLNNSAVKAFIDAAVAGGDVKNGQTITIVLDTKSNGIYYEDNKGKVTVIPNDKNANAAILAIWLGKTADSGLAALKKQLLGE